MSSATAQDDAQYFDDWYWTSEGVMDNVCPGMQIFKCVPPNACARDRSNGKQYCCDKQKSGGSVCWGITGGCSSNGDTINCGSGTDAYCCLAKTEKCSETSGQSGFCWNKATDILNNITYADLDKAFSSSSSASAKATSWAFDPLKLAGFTAAPTPTGSSSSSSSTKTSPTSSSTSGSTSTSTPAPDTGSSSSLSGGAIAGVAIGAVAGVALIGVLFWFLRRRRRQGGDSPDSSNIAYSKVEPGHSPAGGTLYSPPADSAHQQGQYAPQYAPQQEYYKPADGQHVPELEARTVSELAGGDARHELPTEHSQHGLR